MAGITTQSSESRLLQEGINAVVTIEYDDYQMEYDKIFDSFDSEKAYEIDVALSGMGLASRKPEGSSISYDDEKQDFVKNYTHAVFALGTIITWEAQLNNKYRDLVNKAGKMLKRSLVHTDEQLAANVIDDAYTVSNGMDGVPLFSTAHVLGKGGTFSNRFAVFTALSQSAIEDGWIAVEDFRDGAGLLIDAKIESLHIPRQLRFVAEKLLGSHYEPNSANVATINTVYDKFPKGTHVNHRFATTTDWFMKTNVEDGFKIFTRVPYTFSQDNDFGTENFRSKGIFYKSYGFTDPRIAWGSGT